MDPGSEVSLIAEKLVRQLRLKTLKTSLCITGVGETASGPASGKVLLRLRSRYSDFDIDLTAYVFSKLTTSLPTFSSGNLHWDHLAGLQLADPDFLVPAPIDILIGADAYGQLVKSEVIRNGAHSPVAQLTQFGWIVFGPTELPTTTEAISTQVSLDNRALYDLLAKFWLQEEAPSREGSELSPEERECERHFVSTHSRDNSGRYIVRLPLSECPSSLGESYGTACACLQRLLRRLSRDSVYAQLYKDFLKEYEELGHMRSVPDSCHSTPVGDLLAVGHAPEMTLAHDALASGGLRVSGNCPAVQAHSSPGYYLPHHGVLRLQSESTKLRVVFNGSSKTSSGKSLNDIMHTGAKLHKDISDVLLWSRQHKLIFMTDITKMFRQIRVHSDDWPLQQILWIDSEDNVATYQLTTVTYGTRAAPFLAGRVLLQLVNDEGQRFPLAISPLTNGRYVDDICGGADTLDQLRETARQVRELCSAGGFSLAKWNSNCPELFKTFSPGRINQKQRSYEESQPKILGISWKPDSDEFVFSTTKPENTIISKRVILSDIAQLFDPLGFLSPVVIRAKILLQGLWIDKLGWDDPVSEQTAHRWTQFRRELDLLSRVSIPRWLGLSQTSRAEIHGFSDASQYAMAAVVYLKVWTGEDPPKVTLVCSKTKVAPLKRLSIPRLELTAAVLLAKLCNYVKNQLTLTNSSVFLWTDSSVTLTWISSPPSRWKEFVRNRVMLIQEMTEEAQWRLVPGKENPADCASRGLSAVQLSSHKLWWDGPPWLQSDPSTWPSPRPNPDLAINLEEKPGVVSTAQVSTLVLWDLVGRFSTLDKLLRITAICQRCIARFKKIPGSSLVTPLTLADMESARLYWIKATQAAHFTTELKMLSRGQRLNKSHPLTRLTAFVDHDGVLRVGGRLKFAQISSESKHQVILPKESTLAQLIIKEAHDKTLHGGTQLTLAHLRQSYWVLGGRGPVRSFILKCVRCARQRGIRAQQLMGQLPVARITPARAFLNSGVDYAGPVSLRSWKGRGHKSYKGWLVIFVCMATSAVHLEVVSDYSAEGFLSAYRRFIARRGICRNLFSDCGTNFVGANKELQRLFASGTKDARHLAQLLLQDGTQWSFNPPGAPHFGGKWEAAVKSVKYHLRRTVGEALLTFEELTTLLAQIEAVLNSRPLEPLSEDSDDLAALTPGHFLIGEPPTTVPAPSLQDLNISRLSRWQLIQQRLQYFWKRWSTSYLQRLQSISKWHHPSHHVKVGSMVLLTDERFPPAKWPLARITALHPGQDGLTRVVTIRTANSTLDRPVSKLVLLPIASEAQE